MCACRILIKNTYLLTYLHPVYSPQASTHDYECEYALMHEIILLSITRNKS